MTTQYYVFCLLIQGVFALDCLTCTYKRLDSSLSWVNSAQDYFTNSECPYATNAQKGVTMENCGSDPGSGKVNRCGDIDVKYKTSLASYRLHVRGCLVVRTDLEGGCHSDQNLIDDQNALIVSKADSNVDSFIGQLCINTDEVPTAWLDVNTAGNISLSYFVTIFNLLFLLLL